MLSTFSPPLLPVLPLTVKALIALGAIASFHEAAVPYLFIDYKNTYWKANATAYLAILLLPLSFWSQIGVLCLPMLLHYYRVVHKPQKNWRKNFSIKKPFDISTRQQRILSNQDEKDLAQEIDNYHTRKNKINSPASQNNLDNKTDTLDKTIQKLEDKEHITNCASWFCCLFGLSNIGFFEHIQFKYGIIYRPMLLSHTLWQIDWSSLPKKTFLHLYNLLFTLMHLPYQTLLFVAQSMQRPLRIALRKERNHINLSNISNHLIQHLRLGLKQTIFTLTVLPVIILAYPITWPFSLLCRTFDWITHPLENKGITLGDWICDNIQEICLHLLTYSCLYKLGLYGTVGLHADWILPSLTAILVLANHHLEWKPFLVDSYVRLIQTTGALISCIYSKHTLIRLGTINAIFSFIFKLPRTLTQYMWRKLEESCKTQPDENPFIACSRLIPPVHRYMLTLHQAFIHHEKRSQKEIDLQNHIGLQDHIEKPIDPSNQDSQTLHPFITQTWKPFLKDYLELKRMSETQKSSLDFNHHYVKNPRNINAIDNLLPTHPQEKEALQQWNQDKATACLNEVLSAYPHPDDFLKEYAVNYKPNEHNAGQNANPAYQMLKAALDQNNCRNLIEKIDQTIQKHLALDDGGIYKSWTEIIRQFVFMLEKIQDKRTNEKTKKNLLIILKKNMMQIINEHHSCAKGLITYLGNIYTENYFKLISILQQHESHLEASIQRQLHQNLEDLVYSIKIWQKDPKEKPTWLFEALNKEHIPEFAKRQIIQLLSKDLNETNNMVGAENVHYSNLLHIFLAPKQNKDLIKKFKNTHFDFERFTLLPYADLYERYPLSELVRDQTFYNLYKIGLTHLTSNIAFDNQEWLQSPNPIELENHPARYFEEAHTVLGQQGINIKDQKTCLSLIECSTGNLKNTPIAIYAAFEEIMANKDASYYTTPKRLTLQDIKTFMDDIEKKANQNPKDVDVISYYKKIHSIVFDMVRNPLGPYQKENSFGCKTCHSVEAHHQRFLHWVQTQDVEDNHPLKKHLTEEANHHLLRNIALPFIGLILMETGLLYKYRPNKTYGRTITTSISQIQKTSPHHPKQKKSNAFPIPISPRKSFVQCIEHTADLLVFLVQLPMNLLAALFPIKHHWIFINPIYVLLETPYAILRGCVDLFKYLCKYPQSSNNTYFSYKTCSIDTRITLLEVVKTSVSTLPKHCLGLLLHLPLTVVELAYQSVKLALKIIYNSTKVFIDSIFVYPCYVLSCLILAVLKHILKPTLSALGQTSYTTGTLLVQGFQMASTSLLTGLHTCIFKPLTFILNQTLEKALTIGRITHAILNLILWNPIRKLYHYPLAITSSLKPLKSLNLKHMSFSKEVTSITWNQESKTPNPITHKAITH